MNKNIIFGVCGFVGGLVTGYFIGQTLSEKKEEAKKNEEPYYVHLGYFDKQAPFDDQDPQTEEKVEEEPEEKEERKFIDYTKYSKMVQEQKYSAESEFPVDENEPEEVADKYEGFYETEEEHDERISKELAEEAKKFKEKHGDKIELMSKKEWDSDFPEEDYARYELWYFPDSDELCDENGALLMPKERYVGDCFRKVGFESNDDDVIYIRNGIMEEDYYIHKELEATREEYFLTINI